MYVLIDKNNSCWHSKMKKPLARVAGVDVRTIRSWLNNPHLAVGKGYLWYESNEAPHYKKGNF